MPALNGIDPQRLQTDTTYAFSYYAEYIRLNENDQETLAKNAKVLVEAIPDFVEGIFRRIFERPHLLPYFMGPQENYAGESPTLEALLNNGQKEHIILTRKKQLAEFLVRLFKEPLNTPQILYIEHFAAVHAKLPVVEVDAMISFVKLEIMTFILGQRMSQADIQSLALAFAKIVEIFGHFVNKARQDKLSGTLGTQSTTKTKKSSKGA